MSIETAESVVLERLVPELKSQGYDVFVHPGRQMVPAFLETYVPDVIALRDDKNLVIEIKAETIVMEDRECVITILKVDHFYPAS